MQSKSDDVILFMKIVIPKYNVVTASTLPNMQLLKTFSDCPSYSLIDLKAFLTKRSCFTDLTFNILFETCQSSTCNYS